MLRRKQRHTTRVLVLINEILKEKQAKIEIRKRKLRCHCYNGATRSQSNYGALNRTENDWVDPEQGFAQTRLPAYRDHVRVNHSILNAPERTAETP